MKKIRKQLFEIIFEADTKSGRVFDITILIIICLSVIVVILESVPEFRSKYNYTLDVLEWIFTGVFAVEYFLRVYVTKKRIRYTLSFYGIIDLIAILPGFIIYFFTAAHGIMVIRAFRLLRLFRILKITRYISAGQTLTKALVASKAKISVFLFAVLSVVLFVGTIMYMIEGEANGFTSIPKAIYWAIVTLTTVGYGDITPQTVLGQMLSSVVMILGYAIIAVPTGIISVELAKASKNTQVCPSCMKDNHEDDAQYCSHCGAEINPKENNI